MNRYSLGIIVAAVGSLGAAGIVACSDSISDGPIATGGATGQGGSTGTTGGATGTGATANGGSTPSGGAKCEGECCPTDNACYSSSAGVNAPGSECLATRDNSNQEHIQLRQQWISATKPVGNTSPTVYAVLAGRTQLPQPDCNQGTPTSALLGSGGYIQLIDYYLPGGASGPIDNHVSTVGFAQFVSTEVAGTNPDVAQTLSSALSDGLCLVTDAYAGKTGYQLESAKMAPASRLASWKAGPKPMGLAGGATWNVKPARAKRVAQDFDLSKDRDTILARFADGGDLAGKFDGIFFMDPATGVSHGYSPMSWVVVYSDKGKGHISIPIREAELKGKFNDPKAPNCIGAYRTNSLTTAGKCESTDPKNPPWGCLNDSCPAGTAPGTTGGYFLISELDQVYSPDLGATLCTTYPPPSAMGQPPNEGFFDDATKSCAKSAKWDPTKEDDAGLPHGDWCSQTNGPATDKCHDAWRSETYHVFSGAKIKGDAATTCTLKDAPP